LAEKALTNISLVSTTLGVSFITLTRGDRKIGKPSVRPRLPLPARVRGSAELGGGNCLGKSNSKSSDVRSDPRLYRVQEKPVLPLHQVFERLCFFLSYSVRWPRAQSYKTFFRV